MYPTDWVRLYFDINEEFTNTKIVIAVDTLLAKMNMIELVLN